MSEEQLAILAQAVELQDTIHGVKVLYEELDRLMMQLVKSGFQEGEIKQMFHVEQEEV